MKVLAFSDLHLDVAACDAILTQADKAELVIGAGDFAAQREGLADFMMRLSPIADKAIYVPGNHESYDELREAKTAHVLHGTSMVWQGVTVAGLGAAIPPQPPFPPYSFDLTEDQAVRALSGLSKADILVSHSPPKGAGDRHNSLGSAGSTALRDAAMRLMPKLMLCGHIHDDWGFDGWLGTTQVCNLGPTPNWFEV